MSFGHQHGGGHGHDHAGAHRRSRLDERRRVLLALALTVAVMGVEVAGGLAARSLALLSDAGHMLSDAAAQVLSLVAIAIAARPTDARRTWGYHRVEILAALANGVALIVLSGWILWKAYHRLVVGAAPVHTGLMIGVAIVGLATNLVGAWLLRGANSLNVRGAYLHLLLDSLSSVAVIAGGAVMAFAGGWYVIDPILSVAIGVFVNWSAYLLVREAVDVLLETAPRHLDTEEVARAMAACDGVRAVHDLHLWTITSQLYALSAHVVVRAGDLAASDGLLTRLKETLHARFRIAHTTIQIESDAYEHIEHTCGDAPEGRR